MTRRRVVHLGRCSSLPGLRPRRRAGGGAPRASCMRWAPVGMTVARHGPLDRLLLATCSTSRRSPTSKSAGETYEQLEGVFGLRMRVVRMRLGDETIELTRVPGAARTAGAGGLAQQRPLVPARRDHRQRHGPRLRRLRAAQGRARLAGPQQLPDWNPNAAGIRAFYFKDPDGHALEILQFPPGKGDPQLAPADRSAVPRHRPHRHRRRRHRGQPALLPRHARPAGWSARARTTAPSRSISTTCSAPACASPVCGRAAGPGHRVPRVPDAAGRPANPGGRARQRPGALADSSGRRRRRGGVMGNARKRMWDAVAERGGAGGADAGLRSRCPAPRPRRPRVTGCAALTRPASPGRQGKDHGRLRVCVAFAPGLS